MTTLSEAAAAIDTHTNAVFSAEGISVVYGNGDDNYFRGSETYVKQQVIWQRSKQLYLGSNKSSRKRGTVAFVICYQKNYGDAERNRVVEILDRSFRDQEIGGVHFNDLSFRPRTTTQTWVLSGVMAPFHFNDVV